MQFPLNVPTKKKKKKKIIVFEKCLQVKIVECATVFTDIF